MTQEKHTLLPYEIYNGDEVRAVGGQRIAHCMANHEHPAKTTAEEYANAQFIVRSCNLHYDLLSLCKEALDIAEASSYEDLEERDAKIVSWIFKNKETIAKAEAA